MQSRTADKITAFPADIKIFAEKIKKVLFRHSLPEAKKPHP
jgi:hypothetical protein